MGGNNTIRRLPGEKPIFSPPKRTANKAAAMTEKTE